MKNKSARLLDVKTLSICCCSQVRAGLEGVGFDSRFVRSVIMPPRRDFVIISLIFKLPSGLISSFYLCQHVCVFCMWVDTHRPTGSCRIAALKLCQMF